MGMATSTTPCTGTMASDSASRAARLSGGMGRAGPGARPRSRGVEVLEHEGVHVRRGILAEDAVDVPVPRDYVAPVPVLPVDCAELLERELGADWEEALVVSTVDECDG